MNVNDIKTVTIIGCGTMGNGIAQVFASCGYKVNLVDIKQEFLDKAIAGISKSLDRFVNKEKITEADKNAAMANIGTSTDLASAKNSQLVIEAVTENLDIKIEIFKKLEEVCPP